MLQKEIGERTIDINYVHYREDRIIVGFETEKMGKGQAFTGISTKAVDLLTVRMKHTNQAN